MTFFFVNTPDVLGALLWNHTKFGLVTRFYFSPPSTNGTTKM